MARCVIKSFVNAWKTWRRVTMARALGLRVTTVQQIGTSWGWQKGEKNGHASRTTMMTMGRGMNWIKDAKEEWCFEIVVQ